MSYLIEYAKLAGQKKPLVESGADTLFVQNFRRMKVKGTQPLSVDDWFATMKQALQANDPDSDLTYNDFDLNKVAKALRTVPALSLTPAREYSPAVYVSGPQESLEKVLKLAKRIHADEADYQEDGTVRLWWD